MTEAPPADARHDEPRPRSDGEPPAKERGPPPKPPRRRVFVAVFVVLLLAVAFGAYTHWRRDADAKQTQRDAEAFVPTVRTGFAKLLDEPIKMTLPGQTEAFDTAAIHARATGYIAERHVDIGSRVHKGDLMLRISAPDLDAQLAQAAAQLGQFQAALLQAQAQLQQAQANSSLADVTNRRTSTLAREGWETKQNADNSRTNVNTQTANVASSSAGIRVAEANLKAQLATIQRLTELTGFERIVAPFDGVVTERHVDTGDLVAADGGGTSLLTVQSDNVLRVAVQVPQSGAVSLRNGLEASITVPELPSRTFKARVARNAVALDATSRTMLAEVDVPNPDHALRPGLYVEVNFDVPREAPGVVVPDEALVFNAAGLQVATVSDDGTVQLRKVSIYRDFGTTVELRDGLNGGERVALSLPADRGDGSKVKIAQDKPDGSPAAPNPAVSDKRPAPREKEG